MKPKNDGCARVSKKSLLQLMTIDRRKLVLNKTWMGMRNDLEDSQKIFSKIANANRFFTNERTSSGATARQWNAASRASASTTILTQACTYAYLCAGRARGRLRPASR
jgi:hypothetical protein